MRSPEVSIIGAGLAGTEAAHALTRRGVCVELFEMRPSRMTPAHRTDQLAELVCSNSFKGTDPLTAHGILKREMERLGSLILSSAEKTRVPAGKALAVDRTAFARSITDRIMLDGAIILRRREVEAIEESRPTIIATGPLTSDALAGHLASITASSRLFFYDAISPIIEADSIDMDHAFPGSRWTDANTDYINCPLDRQGYSLFLEEVLAADRVRAHEFEDARFFEACLPIEVLAHRGNDALRYGPMRPVGLKDPRTEKRPYAVVQLRRENLQGQAYTLVGFQTRLTYPEQKRIISMIPALRNTRFLRYGSIHRNTYLDSPRILEPDLRLRGSDKIYLAGQITGVEGYMESAAMGIMAGISVLAKIKGVPFSPPGPETAMGSLIRYITDRTVEKFQPMNTNFGIMPAPDVPKNRRAEARSELALHVFEEWVQSMRSVLG
ncbi:MAG TPA: methylenetetrahydrofolate--tRNA-(uracil(54)-C(5))-methyltransferase (FADH(2)-oxidizing) TrmFO [Deltaproteobacteria bacterium]|nr:methylenetetrahydrofolate--tRNA-(uracil(54)-C(5))-methyltransferase (FADH(2)-oxidizing) TrmFO [Deltaproteobacteria bacterium]HPR56308.1 methylenetetrahydrofolate--tRNA-(uracil(54)-C(5))-methyltransferase (FADH(2)-oxidizing) TrmFO [Deltaproteobacteria bacterium]